MPRVDTDHFIWFIFTSRKKQTNKKTTVPVVPFSLVQRKLQHIGETANANFGEFRIDSVPNNVALSRSKFDENMNTIQGAQTEAFNHGSSCCDASLLTNVPPSLSTLKLLLQHNQARLIDLFLQEFLPLFPVLLQNRKRFLEVLSGTADLFRINLQVSSFPWVLLCSECIFFYKAGQSAQPRRSMLVLLRHCLLCTDCIFHCGTSGVVR